MYPSKNIALERKKIQDKYYKFCNKCKKQEADLVNYDGLCPSCYDGYNKEIKKLYKSIKE